MLYHFIKEPILMTHLLQSSWVAFTDEISALKEVTFLLEADLLGRKGISPIPFAFAHLRLSPGG